MPQNIVRTFGTSSTAYDTAVDWADDHADDQGVLHIMEVFAEGREPYGVVYVVSTDQLEDFREEQSDAATIEEQDSYGHDVAQGDWRTA
jgi:hypothetical protein